jgi:hypothetical protein
MEFPEDERPPPSEAAIASLERFAAPRKKTDSPVPMQPVPTVELFGQLHNSVQAVSKTPDIEKWLTGIGQGMMDGHHNPADRVVPQVLSSQQFDPRALLSPRSSLKAGGSSPVGLGITNGERGRSPGMGAQVERLHNIHARAEESPKRPIIIQDDEDEQRKKPKIGRALPGGGLTVKMGELTNAPLPKLTIDLTTTSTSCLSPTHHLLLLMYLFLLIQCR